MTTYDLTEPNPGRRFYVRALERALLDVDATIAELRELEKFRTKEDREAWARDWLDAWETRRELCRDLAKLKPIGPALTAELVVQALELAAANRRNSGDTSGGDVRRYAEANALERYAAELEEASS